MYLKYKYYACFIIPVKVTFNFNFHDQLQSLPTFILINSGIYL